MAKVQLWQRVLIGLALGLMLGALWPAAAPYVAVLGELFVRAIRMLVAPIVLVTIAAGITSLADPRQLGAVGIRAVALFAATTLIAVAVGMAAAALVRPGVGAAIGAAAPHALGAPVTPYQQLVGIVPLNIVEALAKGDMLAIIFVAVLLGLGTVLAGEAGRPLARGLQSLSGVLLKVVGLVMLTAPFGVFALAANAVAANGVAVFAVVGRLIAAVVAGSLFQMAVVHAAILLLLARRSPVGFVRAIAEPLAVGFATSSSAATLPVALRVAGERLRLPRGVYATVLPVGASIGKDGTAMYVGLLTVFAIQALGLPAGPATYALALLVGAVAAFGTAPVPSASLFMLAAVLSAVGATPEQTALVVGFILPFDRLPDMLRTVPSVCANLTVAATVARWDRGGDHSPAA